MAHHTGGGAWEPLLILIELYILNVALLLVLAYSAWRLDPQDGPLALLTGYLLAVDLCIRGLKVAWYQVYQHSTILRFGLGWPVDVLFVSGFAAHWVVAFRYHRDRWPARLGSRACALAGVLLLVAGVHAVQRLHLGLGPWEVGVRWVALHGSCLASVVLAGWHLAQVLRKKEVAVAHLALGLFIVIAIVQFCLALRPWAWDMSLFHLANLTVQTVVLGVYGVRLARSALWPGPVNRRR